MGESGLTADDKKTREVVEDFVIAKGSAKAFFLRKGQTLRITAHEGKQVADVKFINAYDHREQV